jgi:hypothetical protein
MIPGKSSEKARAERMKKDLGVNTMASDGSEVMPETKSVDIALQAV